MIIRITFISFSKWSERERNEVEVIASLNLPRVAAGKSQAGEIGPASGRPIVATREKGHLSPPWKGHALESFRWSGHAQV